MDAQFQPDHFNRLAERLKGGDQRAGEIIFDYFAPKIFRFAMTRVGQRETAEDLTQDIFLKVVRKIATFNAGLGSFSSWIWQITRNTLKDYYREKKPIPLSHLQEVEFIDKNAENFNTIDRARIIEVLTLVQSFSSNEQEIFAHRYLSDLSYSQISTITGKSEASLRTVIHRINQKIRNMLYD